MEINVHFQVHSCSLHLNSFLLCDRYVDNWYNLVGDFDDGPVGFSAMKADVEKAVQEAQDTNQKVLKDGKKCRNYTCEIFTP